MSSKAMKKISTMLLTTILFIVFSATQVMAAGFTDIIASRYDWVRPYIQKMNLAGVVKGMTETTYSPDASVTREQLITMLIRLMGWESQAKGKDLPSTFPKVESVMPWARGYVAVAVEKGIVSGKDFEDFRPADAAKRSEVAVFAVKAIGLGSEAESRKNVSVSLGFIDGYMIEPEARPYIEVAVEKGIMKGFPDNSFKPNDKFTRAQMATVLHNLSKLTKAYNITSGVVQDVDTMLLPSVEIKLADGSPKTYTVDLSETLIYKEDINGNLAKAQLKDIKYGDSVNIIADRTRAKYIDIASSTQSSIIGGVSIEGTIKDINLIQSILTIKGSDSKEKSYNIKNQTKVYIDGKMATLYELTAGQSVKLTISGSDLEKIDAKGIDKVVKGIIRAVNISTNILTIENEDNDKYESYTIASGARVYRDDKISDLYQLRIGDIATATISDSRIEKIEAESAAKEVIGTIMDITFAVKNPLLIVEDDSGEENEYELDKNVTIRKNSKSADIRDLRKGDEVTLSLEYNKAIRVVAKSVKRDISGTVKAITHADITSVTVIDDKGKEHKVSITRDTDITKDRKRIEATDILPSYYLDMEVENDEAISIDVTVRKVKETMQGKVVSINDKYQVMIINVKKDDGTKEDRQIHYTSDTRILKDNRDIRISRIDEGDEVSVIGQYEDGVFVAETISDLTISE